MRNVLFVILVILLLAGAGAVLARDISPDGQSAYPVPATVTIGAYPITQPTATNTAVPTIPPTTVPEKHKPTKTPPPVEIPDGLPYIPNE